MLGWSTSLITEEEMWSKKASNVDCTNILLHINNWENISVHEKHVKHALKHTAYIMNALKCNATCPQAWKKKKHELNSVIQAANTSMFAVNRWVRNNYKMTIPTSIGLFERNANARLFGFYVLTLSETWKGTKACQQCNCWRMFCVFIWLTLASLYLYRW